ncbi:MAG: ribonuclease III [Firmicutes bacterium]|nr:ribonuclease III [Bacillota bacterium]
MIGEINSLALAYIGDAVYELCVREYLISKGLCKVKELQQESIKYVSAKGQYQILSKMIDERFFNDEELNMIFRARNHKIEHRPKSCDIATYKYATGFEAIIGYLYLNKNYNRINEIMDYIRGE